MAGLFSRQFQDIANLLTNRNKTTAYSFSSSGNKSRAGKVVTPENSMTNSTVFSSVNLIADTISQTDFTIFSKEDVMRTPVSHPVVDMLENPNELMTQYELIHSIIIDILVWGNSYVWMNKVGRTTQLIPLDPQNITLTKNAAGRIIYNETFDGTITPNREFNANQIIHFRDVSVHQGTGLSRVQQCADLIGADWALDDIIADNLSNGNSVSGVLSSETDITPDQAKGIADAWKTKFNGSGTDRGGVMILGGGMEYTPIDFLDLVSSDAIALKTQYMSRIAALFRVPAQYLEIPGNSNYNNVSQKKTGFYSDTLAPLFKNIEQKLTQRLLSGTGLMLEFDKETLIKGDLVSQAGVANNLVAGGVFTPNDGRRFIGYDALAIEGADTLHIPTQANNEANTGGDSRDTANQQEG